MNRRQDTPVQDYAKKIAFGVVPLLFLVGAVFFNVFSYASLGTVGGELYAITLKTDQLVSQNQKITEQLALKTSLRDTLRSAETQGFVPVSKLTQLSIQDTKVALGGAAPISQ